MACIGYKRVLQFACDVGDKPRVDERTVMQEALFYGFSLLARRSVAHIYLGDQAGLLCGASPSRRRQPPRLVDVPIVALWRTIGGAAVLPHSSAGTDAKVGDKLMANVRQALARVAERAKLPWSGPLCFVIPRPLTNEWSLRYFGVDLSLGRFSMRPTLRGVSVRASTPSGAVGGDRRS